DYAAALASLGHSSTRWRDAAASWANRGPTRMSGSMGSTFSVSSTGRPVTDDEEPPPILVTPAVVDAFRVMSRIRLGQPEDVANDLTRLCRGPAARHEFLQPLPVRVGRVHGAFRVDDDAVNPVEFAGTPALFAPHRGDPAVFQIEAQHPLVLVIGDPADAL